MKLEEFYYVLPKELIAQYPLKARDSARLLVLDRKNNTFVHKCFANIADYLKKGDLLVLNDTKVLPARLIGNKPTGGKVDVLLLDKDNDVFHALIKPNLGLNTKVLFDGGRISAEVIAKGRLRFNTQNESDIYKFGIMPLPPYIKRIPDEADARTYQTVFAKIPGAVASPTAGLHFTNTLIKRIKEKGINIAYITLHVNYATFKPVKEEDITKHKMYKEYYNIPLKTIQAIKKTKVSNNRIMAVGTTVCRALETIANLEPIPYLEEKAYSGHTELFIFPGYEFKLTDYLVTNFHLPHTTLLMLVSAFAGRDSISKAYNEAIEKRYRFYSYGDAMLII